VRPVDVGGWGEETGLLVRRDDTLARIVREEAGVVLASLVATFGDLDRAEDAFQEAALAAAEAWPQAGLPDRPGAWLLAVARRKALDRLRHERMRAGKEDEIAAFERNRHADEVDREEGDIATIPDERLRLLFTCCHPALAEEARIALTLRTLGGLAVAEVASAFLLPEATLAKRLARAKKKIREAGIPYRVPHGSELPARLASVLAVIYLIFNHGWSSAEHAATSSLCREAIRLARILVALLPEEPEPRGLLALLLLHHARRDARVVDGVFVPLEEHDPARWDDADLRDGLAELASALERGAIGPYQIQASISAMHVDGRRGASRVEEIAALYATLEELAPSHVVALNRAVAVARVEGPEAGLRSLEALAIRAGADLESYQPYHAARADLLRRAGRTRDAATAYRRAIDLTAGTPERRYLAARLAEVDPGSDRAP
jgi:RNA polymerase sigma-70 factor, ECF subfamily